MLDGGAVSGIEQNGGITEVKFNATVDVVEEFKVQTNYFSAEFGNSGGTIINMVSKSGTNQLHGVGYYFRSDAAMNANNWFSNSRGGTLVDSHQEQLRGHARRPGSPPGSLQRKEQDVLFRRLRSRHKPVGHHDDGQRAHGAAAGRRLFGHAPPNGNLVPIFDPSSTFVDASGNTMRNPIPGNIIPAARLNKIAQAFDKYFPAPNQPGDPFTRVNNWFAQGSTPSASNKADAKIDHNISEKQRLSARYGVNWGWNGVANLTGNISHNGNPGFNRFQNFIVDYTRTHSPTTVFTARAGVLRAKSVRDPLSVGFDAVKELGISPLFQAAGVQAFPNYSTRTIARWAPAGLRSSTGSRMSTNSRAR